MLLHEGYTRPSDLPAKFPRVVSISQAPEGKGTPQRQRRNTEVHTGDKSRCLLGSPASRGVPARGLPTPCPAPSTEDVREGRQKGSKPSRHGNQEASLALTRLLRLVKEMYFLIKWERRH